MAWRRKKKREKPRQSNGSKRLIKWGAERRQPRQRQAQYVTCSVCHQYEQPFNRGCAARAIEFNGREFERRRFEGYTGPYCTDCGVRKGGTHHVGCSADRCPVCGRTHADCGGSHKPERYVGTWVRQPKAKA